MYWHKVYNYEICCEDILRKPWGYIVYTCISFYHVYKFHFLCRSCRKICLSDASMVMLTWTVAVAVAVARGETLFKIYFTIDVYDVPDVPGTLRYQGLK